MSSVITTIKEVVFFLCLLYDVLYHADIIMMILRVFFNVLVRPDGKVYKDICDMAKMPF